MAKKAEAIIADVDEPIGETADSSADTSIKRTGVKVTTNAGVERWFFPDDHYTTAWQIWNEIVNGRGAFLPIGGVAIGLGTVAFVEIAEEA